MTPEESAVLRAAIRWWEARRPVSWSKGRHAVNPKVNCSSDAEAELAMAVAAAVAAKVAWKRS